MTYEEINIKIYYMYFKGQKVVLERDSEISRWPSSVSKKIRISEIKKISDTDNYPYPDPYPVSYSKPYPYPYPLKNYPNPDPYPKISVSEYPNSPFSGFGSG